MPEDGEARRGEDGLTELHCHLDGSLRPSTFIELYQQVQQAGGKREGWRIPDQKPTRAQNPAVFLSGQ
jgi:hypothetical protein